MTIQEAYNFIESLKTETTNKSEIKIYDKFATILSSLKNRTFSKKDIQSIENELDKLNVEPKNRKKFFKKALSEFEKYLRNTFTLTSKGYYTNLYGALGLSFGLLFGVAILSNLERSLGISLGLLGGMVVGSIIGRSKDANAMREGNVL